MSHELWHVSHELWHFTCSRLMHSYEYINIHVYIQPTACGVSQFVTLMSQFVTRHSLWRVGWCTAMDTYIYMCIYSLLLVEIITVRDSYVTLYDSSQFVTGLLVGSGGEQIICYSLLHVECHSSWLICHSSWLICHSSWLITVRDGVACGHHMLQPIAWGVSFNQILQSQTNWSLFNGTWQKRPRKLNKWLSLYVTAYRKGSISSPISKPHRWSSSLGLLCHLPMKRDLLDKWN